MNASVSPPPLPGLAGRNFIGGPIAGICVTDQPYGAIDDGLNGYFYTTWTLNGTSLSIYGSNVAVTVANTGPNGVAQLTIPGANGGNGAAPHPSWVNKPIAIAGAGVSGATFVSRVATVFLDSTNAYAATVVLTSAAPTPLTNSVQKVACPCFVSGTDGSGLPTCVGKELWIATGGAVAGGYAYSPQYAVPLAATIAAYISPFQVTLGTAITANSQTAQIAYLEWGTNNSPAVTAAGLAAIAGGYDTLFFPGRLTANSTGHFCLFDWETNGPAPTTADFVNSGLISALNWVGSGSTTFITSATGANGAGSNGRFQNNELYKPVIPVFAPGAPAPMTTVDAPVHFPRCATLNTIVVLPVGDSWSNTDPSGESNAVFGPFLANLQRRNPGKRIVVANAQGINGLTWNALKAALSTYATVTVDGLGSVTPDLVLLFVTGGNDGTYIYRNDIQTCINMVKGWGKTNGLPPDICLLTGTYPRTFEQFSLDNDQQMTTAEYATVLQRSMARTRGYPIVDLARHGAFALRGWCEDQLPMKQVPPPNGSGTAGTWAAPYIVPLQCRDFFMAIALGTGSGSSFWSTVGGLNIALSPKPDNRVIISVDGSNNLNITAVTWGLAVATPVTMTNGSASLVTSGQTSITPSYINPQAPQFSLFNSSGQFTSAMVGQCFVAPGAYNGVDDFRTWLSAYTNSQIAFGCDGCYDSSTPGSTYIGGTMFVAGDATAQADCIVAGAGSTLHPLTGANSLVTSVIGYTSRTSVTLAAPATASISSTVNVFIGSISVQPTYNTAVAAGSDAGNVPILTIKKTGTHVRVGYILGGQTYTDIRVDIQAHETVWWEGEVECFGGPFFPRIWATLAAATIQVLDLWIDDRNLNLRRPYMTMREAFGTADLSYAFMPSGGDSGHPSQIYLSQAIHEATATQNLAIGNNTANNNATVVATSAGYTIPANQVFTDLTPAGTLATCPVTLPSVFPQGARLEIFTSQAITSWAISAPSGFSLAGPAVSAATAGQTIAYRLTGTTWTRVQ